MKPSQRLSTKDLALISMSVAIITVCAWISIPFTIPVTLQTFSIFLTISLLGRYKSFLAVTIYLLLGAVGCPVFSGFTGGIGHLLGPTGGYLTGFLFSSLVGGTLSEHFGKGKPAYFLSMGAGLFSCYLFGTFWFLLTFIRSFTAENILTALSVCVIPFIIPDICKMILSFLIVRRLQKHF